jgi:ribosomal protein S3
MWCQACTLHCYCCACSFQFIADGVFFAELNELLTRELAEDGYSGVEVRVTPMRTEIIIRATRTQNVLGEQPAAVRAGRSVAQQHRWQLRCTYQPGCM